MTTAERLTTKGFTKEVAGNNFDLIVQAYDYAMSEQKTGIVIQGDVGCGKTFAMKCLFEDTAMMNLNNHLNLKFLQPHERTVQVHGLDKDIENWWVVKDNEDIILDDLGNEQVKNEYGIKIEVVAGFVIQWYNSSFSRLDMSARLFATTNLTDDQLISRYGMRFFDRLSEMCSFVKFEGSSKRKTKRVFK